MADICTKCGTRLPFLQRFSGRTICSSCAAEETQAQKAAEQEYKVALVELISRAAPVTEIQNSLAALSRHAALPDARVRDLHMRTFRSFLEEALEDDHLTEEEEARMNALAGALGIGQKAFDIELADLRPQMIVARVNNGRLPVLPAAHIILKKREVAHIEANAALLKEVAVREWQGAYRGMSFRVAKGVRLHTGGARGRSVVVDTRMEAEDTGTLTLTSQRAVFAGRRRTVEMPYSKLVNLNVFADGVQFHMSNRKNPPMFQVNQGVGHVVAAVVNAAAQEYLS